MPRLTQLLMLAVLALGAFGAPAAVEAQPYRYRPPYHRPFHRRYRTVCYWRHHHRICDRRFY